MADPRAARLVKLSFLLALLGALVVLLVPLGRSCSVSLAVEPPVENCRSVWLVSVDGVRIVVVVLVPVLVAAIPWMLGSTRLRRAA